MKVVITSATAKEAEQIKQRVAGFDNPQVQISFHESGVGMLVAGFSIAKLIFTEKPDLIIQAGIAGTFDAHIAPGKVVAVKEEFMADTGVEENLRFNDVFDLGLLHHNTFPFCSRGLKNSLLNEYNFLKLAAVTGVTINEITTRADRIEELKAKYGADVESMEGASLHYCCLQTSTPFIQIRAISNHIGERNKSKWKFREAFDSLAATVSEYVEHLQNRM